MWGTVAGLKRFMHPGLRYEVTHTLIGPCFPPFQREVATVHGSYWTAQRPVDRERSPSDRLPEGRRARADYPKASAYVPLPDGFRFMGESEIALEVRFLGREGGGA